MARLEQNLDDIVALLSRMVMNGRIEWLTHGPTEWQG